jgi:hypothetical protein
MRLVEEGEASARRCHLIPAARPLRSSSEHSRAERWNF